MWKISSIMHRAGDWWRRLGPGLITGASDDDPSGITTYSIAGAQIGKRAFWMPIYTLPLMIAIQEMCARIGMVTGHGLAGTIRRHYPKGLLAVTAVLLVGANTLNIGADLHGMAESFRLLVPAVPAWAAAIFFAVLIVGLMIRFPYHKIAAVLKWLALSLLAYIATAFVTSQDWPRILFAAAVPHFEWSARFIGIFVAVLGTTISPYLFFWGASEEVEERRRLAGSTAGWKPSKDDLKTMRRDVATGMFFSNLVMFFIIATTTSVFYNSGLDEASSVADVAAALRPLAGDAAFLLFALGVIGTGLLAIPVLAGSSAYALAEAFGWNEGLDRKFGEARGFYTTVIVSTAIGCILPFTGLGAVYLMFLTAMVYGIVSPPLIAIILHIANNRSVMGEHVNGRWSNILGGLTLAVMTFAAAALLWFQFH